MRAGFNMDTMQAAYDHDGVLVGHYGKVWLADGKQATVFIPRRDEDIEADRRNRKRKRKVTNG